MNSNTFSQQLEMGIAAGAVRKRRPAKPCRPARARWWFEQMRRVVEQATEWPARRTQPPRQITLPLVRGS